MRNVSLNTGFVGHRYASSACLVCGCSNTPFASTLAPNGTVFSDAANAAGSTLNVAAGDLVDLVMSGLPGQGWPHPDGHLLAYMAWCGPGTTDCQTFDAATGQYFKILEAHKSYDATIDGDPWSIRIPKSLAQGSYILRAEIVDWLSASQLEGYQNELSALDYGFCAQIFVAGNGTAVPTNTIRFPDAYALDSRLGGALCVNAVLDHIDPCSATYVPGPPVFDDSNPAPADTQGVASPRSLAASGSSSSGSSNIGAIAGGAAAGAVALIAGLVALWWCRRRQGRSPTPYEVDETGDDTAYKPTSAVASPYMLPHQSSDRPPVDSYYGAHSTATPHMSMAPSMTTVPLERYSLASTMPNPHDQYAESSRYSVQSGPTVASVGHGALPLPPSHGSTSSASAIGPYRTADGKSQAGPSMIGEEPPIVHEDAGPAHDEPASPRAELPPSYGSQRPL